MTGRPTYREYERRRLGRPANRLAGIAFMFRRSFSSSTFAGFWRCWNPLFSYYLYYNCYKPLVQFLPRPFAVVLTFLVSGAIHDFLASVILLDVYVLFSPVFAFFGLLVVIEEGLSFNFSWASLWLRSTIYIVIIAGTVLIALSIQSMLS